MPSSAGDLSLIGGVLALDFANSASGRGTASAQEHIHSLDDLVAWGTHAGCLGPATATRSALATAANPLATELLRRALRLREAIFAIGSAIAHGREPATNDLDIARLAVRDAMASGALKPRYGGYGLDFGDAPPAAAVIGPVALSALDMLETADFTRIKQCPGMTPDNDCQWLFLDVSKNNSRRWCDMATCGNRTKSHRHRARKQGPA
jgi:predicted RNA-binding Zn ribbon-like protein